ncbi:hypothetical protein L596_023090 [Steinernema carpocapsae]|uniref:Uncharacterized protein n=1 Tax=Steinernema carpocapsae TaxID=34508 RepID=A0A4U5MCL3_STECR|nr:hypothetical protein L596_023090 [Steinernema carpocapsae]
MRAPICPPIVVPVDDVVVKRCAQSISENFRISGRCYPFECAFAGGEEAEESLRSTTFALRVETCLVIK